MTALGGGLARPFERLSDRTGADALVGQRLLTVDGESVAVPTDAAFALLEVQAKGGGNIGNTAYASGGGAASDAIVAVQAGQTVSASLPYSSTAAETASISYAGTVAASASSPPASTSASQPGASGKYPGLPASNRTGGRGGGRLAGAVTPGNDASTNLSAGYGCGQSSASLASRSGMPVACVTFFRTYEAAIAFARSLYGGTWTP